MSGDSTPPSERMAAVFIKLRESAKHVNEASGQLAAPIASLEASLQRLNLGVACWTRIAGGGDGDFFWRHDVGHAQVHGRWCIAIRTQEGPEDDPERCKEETWAFNEAPLHLRIKAVDRIPELLESLVEAADAAAKRLRQKVGSAQELAAAMKAAAAGRK